MPCRGVLKSQPESKCPELLANYCDMLLRKTPLSKKLAPEEIETKLKEVVSRNAHPAGLSLTADYCADYCEVIHPSTDFKGCMCCTASLQ